MTRTILAGLMACFLAAQLPAQKSDAETLLQTAIKREVVDGNLSGAIDGYKRALAGAKGNRAVAAMALVRMAGCYRKMGDAQALKLYEQVMKDYADQKEAVTLAQAGLGAAGMAGASGPTRKLLCAGPDCQGWLSPDGTSVLPYGGDIRTVNLATHKVKVLVEPVAGMTQCCRRFSPDGSRIAYTVRPAARFGNEAGTVDVVNSDGSGHRTVYRGGFAQAWSPDGKRLLVGRQPEGKPRNFLTLLWVDIATETAQDLPTAHFNLDVATVSPDGRYIAFNAGKDADAEENVYLMASDGSGETLLAASRAYQEPVGWTPDGKYFLYSQYYDTSARLWAMAVVNGRPQGAPIDLHTELDKSSFGSVSPSGAVSYHTRASDADIFTATLDPATGKVTSGPVPVPLARTGANVLPRWAPDSRRLGYEWAHTAIVDGHATEIRELSIYSFDTGEEKRVAAQSKFAVPAYCWRGDGGSMLLNILDGQNRSVASRYNLDDGRISPLFPQLPAFSLRHCSGDTGVGFTASGMEVRSFSNSSATEIYKTSAANATWPTVSHDGRNVAFFTPSNGATVLRIAPADGAASRDVLTVNPPAEVPGGWSLAWSPDDRYLYFLQTPAVQGPTQLFRVPVSGGTPESVGLTAEELRDINISPDGTRIAFVRGVLNRPELWTLENYLPSAKR